MTVLPKATQTHGQTAAIGNIRTSWTSRRGLKIEQQLRTRPWQTNTALGIIGVALLLLTRDLIGEFNTYTIGYSGVSGWSAVLYAAAAIIVLTQPVNRYTFGLILAFAIAFRLVTLLPPPHMSTDIYRYAWDGIVQRAHISPYRYVPADPALSLLRAPNQDVYDHINRREYAVTIYPPAAQCIFLIVSWLNATVTFMKLAMILFEGLTLYALVKLLGEMGIRREQSLLYAWCPLLVWEIGSSGHLDSAAMAFIVLALLARYRRSPIATGIFIALAILVKIYPVVLLPALFRRGEYKMPVTVAAVMAIGYGCYSSVGMRVFGFLGGYVKEEGIQTGERYFLLELVHHIPGLGNLPTIFFLGFCAVAFGALMLWCWKTCCDPRFTSISTAQTRLFSLPPEANFILPALALAFTMMLLFAPHYPWYIAWLIPFLTLVPSLTLFSYISGVFYLFTTQLAVGYGPKQFLLNKILYSVVLLAFCFEVLIRRWPVQRFLSGLPEPASKLRANT